MERPRDVRVPRPHLLPPLIPLVALRRQARTRCRTWRPATLPGYRWTRPLREPGRRPQPAGKDQHLGGDSETHQIRRRIRRRGHGGLGLAAAGRARTGAGGGRPGGAGTGGRGRGGPPADELLAAADAVESQRHHLEHVRGRGRHSGRPRRVLPRRNYPDEKISALKGLVDKHQANVVMLQEACGYAPGSNPTPAQLALSHQVRLQTALSEGWTVRHAVVGPRGRPIGRDAVRPRTPTPPCGPAPSRVLPTDPPAGELHPDRQAAAVRVRVGRGRRGVGAGDRGHDRRAQARALAGGLAAAFAQAAEGFEERRDVAAGTTGPRGLTARHLRPDADDPWAFGSRRMETAGSRPDLPAAHGSGDCLGFGRWPAEVHRVRRQAVSPQSPHESEKKPFFRITSFRVYPHPRQLVPDPSSDLFACFSSASFPG